MLLFSPYCKSQYFNPLPPCGGRPRRILTMQEEGAISIHSLRVEGDALGANLLKNERFQSTPSVWRETVPLPPPFATKCISIHSLRVEGDSRIKIVCVLEMYFNPLPPCGGRLAGSSVPGNTHYFNPLPPCGGRPTDLTCAKVLLIFQSTPSVWRETFGGRDSNLSCFDFNPLPPCGGRRCKRNGQKSISGISIHSLRVEGDYAKHQKREKKPNFNPLPPCGGRRRAGKRSPKRPISIHSLRVEGDV